MAVEDLQRAAAISASQNRILEIAVQDASLPETLEAIVREVESLSRTGVLGSILLIADDGAHLRHGAAPNLPRAYNEAIDGIAVSEGVGSCGTAAYRRQTVVVSDIASDPLWADFRNLAAAHRLAACWSIPIVSPQGAVLGTFALYHRETRHPADDDLALVDVVVRTAALIIERKRTEEQLRRSEGRLRFLSVLDEALARARLPTAAMVAATEILGKHLGASRCAYADVDADSDGFTIRADYTAPGLETSAGTYSLDLFGPRAAADMRSGRTLVINNVAAELASGCGREMFQTIGIGAIICCPLVKDGRLAAMMALHQSDAREWTASEIGLVEAVVERCWAHIERIGSEARLRSSEAKFHAIANSVDQMIWSTRPDGYHDYYNDRWYEFTGVPYGSTDGEQWNGMFHPDDQDRAWAIWRHCLDTGEPYHIEYRLRHRSGAYRWVIGRAQCERDDAGSIVRWYGTCTDIDYLKETEQRLRWAQEAGGVGVFHVGADGILHATPEFCRLYGVEERDTHPVARFEALVLPDDRVFVSDLASRAAGTAPLDVEYRIRRADDGDIRWIARKGEIQRDADGTPIRFAGVARDVTERRLASDALAQSEALARTNIERVQLALSAGAIIGTWFWDLPNDRFTVDAGFAHAFGLDPAIGRDALSLAQVVATVHPDDQAGLADAISEAIGRGGAYAHQYRVRRTDGRYYWIEANGRVDHAPDGTPLSFPGVLLDVEERRAVEQERDRATAALRALNDTLEQRIGERTAELMQTEEALRQAQKMEAVGQLTGGIAHDFNNMLTGVIGSLDLIQRNITLGRMDRVDRYIDAASASAQRAAALTSRLLAFGRRQSLDLKPVNVNVLIAGMEELLQRTLGEQIAMEVHLDASLWVGCTDQNQFESALLNLCINARDAMAGGGKLTIETSNTHLDQRYVRDHPELEAGDYVVLCVTDTGSGMDPATMEKVFDPFFTTKPVGQGTGLGLSMIYGFARQSGGHVRIYSEIGDGTTVKLYVRRFVGEIDRKPEEKAATPRGAGETVLVVEDDPSVRMIILEVLGELGYVAIEALDSRTAIPELESTRRIDLLVTDVGLPGMNGRQLAEIARAARPGLKVLFVTGYAENAAVRSGFLEPGMDMMTKPFAVDALANKLREILET